ncbi:MAG: tetratricopeptide repeat protein, partial [bacterium]
MSQTECGMQFARIQSVFIRVNLWFNIFTSKFNSLRLAPCTLHRIFKVISIVIVFSILLMTKTAAAEEPAEPAADTQDAKKQALEHYKTAIELHGAGDIMSAIEEYRNAISLDPNVAEYHAKLGYAYMNIEYFNAAIKELNTAIKLDPNLIDAYINLGFIYDYTNVPHKAIEYSRKALKMAPDNFYALNNLGHVYDRLGLTRVALANYKKSIEIAPDFAQAYDNLGQLYDRIGLVDDAIDTYKKGIEAAPDYAPLYDNIGKTYMKIGDVNNAIDMIKKAIEMTDEYDQTTWIYYNDLGFAYMLQNDL